MEIKLKEFMDDTKTVSLSQGHDGFTVTQEIARGRGIFKYEFQTFKNQQQANAFYNKCVRSAQVKQMAPIACGLMKTR